MGGIWQFVAPMAGRSGAAQMVQPDHGAAAGCQSVADAESHDGIFTGTGQRAASCGAMVGKRRLPDFPPFWLCGN
uniref:Secreted protein n=1 Tax=Parastrongyloides trichosuri TaxID=131310 RepID=A0A0N4ZZM8_PARTI